MLKKGLIIFIHPFAGWILCGTILFVTMEITTIYLALISHFIAAPFIFLGISKHYFRKYNYTNPFITGLFFVSIVMIFDLFIVALVIQRSLVMFESIMGTWLPFLFIFLTVWLTGLEMTRN
jgi:hypothetical protein